MTIPALRPYSGAELNHLMLTLRAQLNEHHPRVALLLTTALFLELAHHLAADEPDAEWMDCVVPILHRELLRGIARLLNGNRPMAVDESSEDRVH